MPTLPTNKKEVERCIAKVNEALRAGYKPPGFNLKSGERNAISVAADALKLKRTTLQSRLRTWKYEHNLEPNWSLYKEPTQEERIEAIQEKSLVEELLRKIDDLESEIANTQTLREHVFELAEADTTPPTWTLPDSKPGSMTGVPILQMTDLQVGEVIEPEALGGFNFYNLKEAERRYRRAIERAIDIHFNHMVNPASPGIVYYRGGDMVHGDVLRVENRATNERGVLACTTALVRWERWGIEQLADKFGKVLVITTPGNHGRNVAKPESKRAEENYDNLSACMLEQAFEDDNRIRFITPTEVDVLIPIMGWNVLFTHGDRIGSKGGEGFIGPAATISRGMKKLVDYYAALGVIIHLIFVGHFHVPLELEYGFSGGSGPGYSEFARDIRARSAQAKQWLVYLHPKYGVTARWQVFLTDPPRRTISQNDAFKW